MYICNQKDKENKNYMKKLIIDLIGIGLTALLLACCSSDKSKAPVSNIFDETNLSEGEKMILAARNEYNLSRVLALCDSLEKTGDISPVAANFYHGGALIYSGKMGEAQQYLEKAIADSMPDAADMRLYLRAKSLLARVLTTEGKFEKALSQALPTLAMMDSLGNKDFGDMTQLSIVIGECQQNLHMANEAAASFAKAYALLREWMAADSTGTDMPRAIIRLDNISSSYISTSDYRKAKTWLEREDSALAVYMTKPEVADDQADDQRQRREGQEVDHRLAGDAADLLHVAHPGDAGRDGQEDHRRDDHLHQLDEGIAERLEGRALLRPEMPEQDAGRDGREHLHIEVLIEFPGTSRLRRRLVKRDRHGFLRRGLARGFLLFSTPLLPCWQSPCQCRAMRVVTRFQWLTRSMGSPPKGSLAAIRTPAG